MHQIDLDRLKLSLRKILKYEGGFILGIMEMIC